MISSVTVLRLTGPVAAIGRAKTAALVSLAAATSIVPNRSVRNFAEPFGVPDHLFAEAVILDHWLAMWVLLSHMRILSWSCGHMPHTKSQVASVRRRSSVTETLVAWCGQAFFAPPQTSSLPVQHQHLKPDSIGFQPQHHLFLAATCWQLLLASFSKFFSTHSKVETFIIDDHLLFVLIFCCVVFLCIDCIIICLLSISSSSQSL